MCIKNIICSFFILQLLFTCTIFSQNSAIIHSPESVNISSDSLLKMNEYFHNLVDQKQLAGIQTAIMREGKLIHFDSYGYADIEKNKHINDESIFRIFSMTKPIVSVALMQLYEQDLFALDDPVSKYIPSLGNEKVYQDSSIVTAINPIRVIDLLTHTSGYNYGRGQDPMLNSYYEEVQLWQATNNQEFVEKLSQVPLQFEPGTDWQYGLSTNICGYLVEVLSGKSLDIYLRDNIFQPLEMNDTHFQLPLEKVDRFTVGYRWDESDGLFVSEQPETSRYVQEVTVFNGGGGLVSTTYDYLKFCQMLLNGGELGNHQLIKRETINLMFKDHLREVRNHQDRLRLPPGEASFGLGFAIKGSDPENLKNVFGWGGAVGTYFKIDTDHDLTYVLMIQLSPYRHLGLRDLFQNFVNASIIGD